MGEERPRSLGWGAKISCTLLALMGGLSLVADPIPAEAVVRPADCLWVGPAHSQGRFNVAFPDKGAVYWTATMSLPPGSTVTLDGQYPHARYMSFNAYDLKGDATASLADVSIAPDRGSRNPFVAGASRSGVHRAYSISVVPRSPSRPMPRNTLEAGAGRQGLFYRVYLPDGGSGMTGGVGLPAAVLRLADGRVLSGAAACRVAGATRTPPPSQTFPRGTYDALRDRSSAPASFPAENPPVFHRVFNVPALVQCVFRSSCSADPVLAPGQYSNLDNAYAVAMVSRAFSGGGSPRPDRHYADHVGHGTQGADHGRFPSASLLVHLSERVVGDDAGGELPG